MKPFKLTESENERLGGQMNHEQMMDWLNSRNMTVEDLLRLRVRKIQRKGLMKRAPITDIPLHVITPVTRPHYLQKVADSISNAKGPHQFSIRWHCIFKNNENRYNVLNIYNKVLDEMSDGWFTFMCDDNQFHPDIFVEFSDAINNNPDMAVFLVSIFARHGQVTKACPEMILPYGVDAAQTFIKREVLGDIRYNVNKPDSADSKIVRDLYKKFPDRFVFSEKILAFYERTIRNDNGDLYYEEDGLIGT